MKNRKPRVSPSLQRKFAPKAQGQDSEQAQRRAAILDAMTKTFEQAWRDAEDLGASPDEARQRAIDALAEANVSQAVQKLLATMRAMDVPAASVEPLGHFSAALSSGLVRLQDEGVALTV